MHNANPDVVTRPPWSAVRAAMKLLTAVADARTAIEAERRFDQLVFRALRSTALISAAYVATQVLRDMEVLSQTEAGFVFGELFDLRIDEYLENDAYYQAHLTGYANQPDEGDPAMQLDHLERELGAREHVLEARFHRARGELGLAELLLRDPDTALAQAAEGECSLIGGKPGPDEEAVDEPDPAVVAAICERIAALATADTSRETVAKYYALTAALREADVASAVAAVRELRNIGLVSFNESVGLVTAIVDPVVTGEIDGDRECVRLQSKIDALSGDQPQESGRRSTSGKTARDLRSLEKRYEARANLVLAMCLRRFGEHEVATLVIEHPKEFERQAALISLGAWGAPNGPD